MSEPQIKSTNLQETEATSPTEEEINRGGEEPTTTITETTPPVAMTNDQPALTGDVKTLKDAFPDLDVEVIETILQSQGGNLDAAFEVLLGMSDPGYKPEPAQTEGLNQLRQDEEYARQLAREGDAHYPQQNNNTTEDNQPLFSFQEIKEELPIIKEKVIEAGTAAKNKIMNLYNQFMTGSADQNGASSSSRGTGVLETGIGNLSFSGNQPKQPPRPAPAPRRRSVDLYQWDGQGEAPTDCNNPLLANTTPQRKQSVTSTPTEQMLSDEEFARQLAREDAEAEAAVAAVHQSTDAANTTTTTEDSDRDEVTFSGLNDKSPSSPTATSTAKQSGYTIPDDDLDDLFDKQDEEESKSALKKN